MILISSTFFVALVLSLALCFLLKGRLPVNKLARFAALLFIFSVSCLVSGYAAIRLQIWWMCQDDVKEYGQCLIDGPNLVIYFFIFPAYLAVSLFSFLFVYFRWLKTPSEDGNGAVQFFRSFTIALSISSLALYLLFYLSTKDSLDNSKAYLQKEFSQLDSTRLVPDAIIGAFDVSFPEEQKFPDYAFYFVNQLFFATAQTDLNKMILDYINFKTANEKVGGWSLGYQINQADRIDKIRYLLNHVAKEYRALQPLRKNLNISICEATRAILSVGNFAGEEEIIGTADRKMAVYLQRSDGRYKAQILACLK